MNGQTSISDFTGFWAVKAGETYWVDGVLPHAMKNGLWLIIDELDFAEAPILSVLNSVLESNGTLMLKEKGNEVVRAHKNFRIFATANAIGQYAEFRGLYQGTNIMNEAFLDRWRCYVIEYLPSDIEAKVLAAAVPRMTETIAKELVKVAAMARQAFINEELQCTFSTRRLLDWAEQTIHFHKLGEQAPFKAAESTIFSKISRENGTVVKGFMSRILLGKNP
jgi:cobaltochelatase CobS